MDAGLAKIMPGRKARFAGIKNQLRQMIRRKAPKIIGDQLRSDADFVGKPLRSTVNGSPSSEKNEEPGLGFWGLGSGKSRSEADRGGSRYGVGGRKDQDQK